MISSTDIQFCWVIKALVWIWEKKQPTCWMWSASWTWQVGIAMGWHNAVSLLFGEKQEGDTVFMVFSSSFLLSLLERYQICFLNPTMRISSPLIQEWSKAKYPHPNPNTLPAWEAHLEITHRQDKPFLFLGSQVNSRTTLNIFQSQNPPTGRAMVASNSTFSRYPAKETNYPIVRNKKERRINARSLSTGGQLSARHFSNRSASHHRRAEL